MKVGLHGFDDLKLSYDAEVFLVSESNSFSLMNCFINVDVGSYSVVASISCHFMLVPSPSQSRTCDKNMGYKL